METVVFLEELDVNDKCSCWLLARRLGARLVGTKAPALEKWVYPKRLSMNAVMIL